jgi:hypothetical protein
LEGSCGALKGSGFTPNIAEVIMDEITLLIHLKVQCSVYLILSYLILSYLILSYLILSYLILSYLILSYLILSPPPYRTVCCVALVTLTVLIYMLLCYCYRGTVITLTCLHDIQSF